MIAFTSPFSLAVIAAAKPLSNLRRKHWREAYRASTPVAATPQQRVDEVIEAVKLSKLEPEAVTEAVLPFHDLLVEVTEGRPIRVRTRLSKMLLVGRLRALSRNLAKLDLACAKGSVQALRVEEVAKDTVMALLPPRTVKLKVKKVTDEEAFVASQVEAPVPTFEEDAVHPTTEAADAAPPETEAEPEAPAEPTAEATSPDADDDSAKDTSEDA